MKNSRLFISLAVVFVLALTFQACNKIKDEKDLLETSEDIADSQEMFDDLSVQGDLYENGNKSVCPFVTITHPDTAEFPKHIVIDFGTGCEGPNGRIREGKIIIDQTGYMYEEGSVRTFTLDSFFVNGFHIEGVREVTCKGRNEDNFLYHTVVISDGVVTFPDGRTITHEANRTRVLIEGESTPFNVYDNKYSITGTASGIDRFGNSYETTITEPIIFDMSCMFRLVQGVKKVTTDEHTMIIDYGEGTCDNIATVTIDDQEPKEIGFRRR
jgi:hypothetical protein